MSRKEYNMLFGLNAKMDASFVATFGKAGQQLVKLQKEIQELSRVQKDISAFEKQKGAIEATGRKLETLQEEHANIQREMEETGEFSAALANQLLKKEQQIDQTTGRLSTQEEKLGQMGEALREAGIDTDNLTQASADLAAEISGLKREQEAAGEKAQKFAQSNVAAFHAIHQAIIAAGIAKALKAIYNVFADATRAAMDFEQAAAGMRRSIGVSNEELAVMSAEIKELSTTIPLTTAELQGIAQQAGQLGIAQQDVMEFTQMIAMLGTTTDATSQQAAYLLAKFMNLIEICVTEYMNLGSAIAMLGDNSATSASAIMQMAQRMEGAASVAGMTAQEVLAISAAVNSVGMSAQAGGTNMAQFIQTLHTAVQTGEGLEAFARTAGMSAAEFATKWGNDATGALVSFIQGLQTASSRGEDAVVILENLGITGQEQSRLLLSLSAAGDLLSDSIHMSNQAWDENIALQEKAGIMYGTTHSQLVMMQNAQNNLRIALGDNFTPVLQQLYSVGTDLFTALAGLVEQNPELVRGLSVTFGVAGAATAGLLGLAAAIKIVAAAKASLLTIMAGPKVLAIIKVAGAVAALAGIVTALATRTRSAEEEARHLTAASRAQFFELQRLRQEYREYVDLHGENSIEARNARREIEELSAEFARNRQTIAEFVEEIRATAEANADLVQSFRDTSAGLDRQDTNVAGLIGRLHTLAGAGYHTAASQEEIRATVDAINRVLPELNLNYQDFIENSADFVEAVETRARAEAERLRNAAAQEAFVELIAKEVELQEQHAALTDEMAAAQERYNAAREAHNALMGSGHSHYWDMFSGSEWQELQAAQTALRELTGAYEELSGAMSENYYYLGNIRAAFGEFAGEAGGAREGYMALQTAIAETRMQMYELAAAYTEVYEAALKSIQGQYRLWDEAAQVIATSVGGATQNIEGQIAYWQEYNQNIANLRDRTSDIEGLAEMIGTFADGSEHSVNMIAGMAEATDEELAAMVESWQLLQAEQKAVADSLAELVTEFGERMDELQRELEATIQEMNLGDEAAQSGINTIQGFINGAYGMLPQVEAAFRRIGQAAMRSIDSQLNINSPSKEMEWRAEMAWAGFINKTHEMQPEVEQAMAETANGGAEAFAREQAEFVAFAPQLLRALSAMESSTSAAMADNGGGTNAVFAVHSGRYGSTVPSISLGGLNVTFNIDAEVAANSSTLQATLFRAGDDLAEYIVSVVEDHEQDRERRVYR